MEISNFFKKKELSLEEQRNQITKDAYRKKNRSHSFFKRTIVLFLFTYGFFFFSPYLLPSVNKGTHFEKNIVYDLGEGKQITVIRYDYSIKEKKAELEIDINDKNFIDGTYHIGASQNSKDKSVNIIVDENLNKIFQILDVNPDSILDFTILFTSSENQTEDSITINYIPSYLTQVNTLPERDIADYKIQRIDLDVKDLETTIRNTENKIAALTDQNKTIDDTILDLEKSKSLKTPEESIEIDEQITENQEKKTENEQTIEEYHQEITKIQSVIQKKLEIIKSLTEGGVSP